MSVELSFDGLPSMVWPFCKILVSGKPLLAANNCAPPTLHVHARGVKIKPTHLRRYREVCRIAPSNVLPHAYLHAIAMPLHLRVFTHELFPVKVLGLVHLRNVIRQLQPIAIDSTLDLQVSYDSLRETESGQEYDIVTRCEVAGQLVWEEVSTMLARRATPGKRPSIERAQRNAEQIVEEKLIAVAANTGRRYALVSGDFNPIHLFDRAAHAFQFKQAIAHGMWSLACCVGLAAESFAESPVELDAQFKLPVYLPSEFVFRQQRTANGADLSLSTPKGDRLHLIVRVRY